MSPYRQHGSSAETAAAVTTKIRNIKIMTACFLLCSAAAVTTEIRNTEIMTACFLLCSAAAAHSGSTEFHHCSTEQLKKSTPPLCETFIFSKCSIFVFTVACSATALLLCYVHAVAPLRQRGRSPVTICRALF